ncbi:outer membrane protein assembly factor BamE domain-containing protein [Marilutibacter maris]|uniref:Outer membrane protein assembly factor BamE n=1 Tax=Marilutibacter maris TaxID=1605891 RepID=A0A2U9T3W1_9GAMM|nr:outer membrane protein assembly factor BamE [Lysobacter maris]AWV07171.1 smpA / OmlA family protein [Lysobacter maris]KAB8195005.1 outer membrane protein assembly factor BamE [Lysobacter maris]
MKKVLVHKVLAVVALSMAFSSAHAIDFLSHKTGTQISAEQFDSFEIGKTTKDQVVEAIGHPGRKEQLGSNQAWYYDFSKIRTFGKNINESTVFEFNGAGVLIEKYKTNNAAPASNALEEAANN